MGKCPLFILFIFASILFFSPQKTYAADADVVINEISSVGNEWIELYNKTDIDIIMIGFTIEDNTAEPVKLDSYIVPANGYKVIVGETDFNFGLNDTGDIVTLRFKKDDDNTVIVDRIVFGNWKKPVDVITENASAPQEGESIARIPNGQDTNNDKADFVVLKTPSPNAKNELPPLVAVTNPSPTNNEVLKDLKINFSWKNDNDPTVKFKLYLSKNSNPEEGNLLSSSEMLVSGTSFSKTLNDQGKYYWKVITYDDFDEISSEDLNFTISEAVYSSDIIINEILAHPSNGTDNEFIELYDTGSESVDLSGWFLDDLADGGSDPYVIANGTMIDSGEYLVFYKIATKLVLNDSGDSVRLIWPNNKLASSAIYNSYATLDFAWARNKDGNFVWTTKSTAGGINIILEPLEDAGGTDEEKPVINKIPIKIKTSKVKNYVDMLVEIEGKVVETSGSTFYIDDSSGKAKVYIQAQTKIDKPKMYKGDIFKIFGVVNLYRNIWRVLPRSQDDIKLVKAVKQNLPVVPKVKTVVAKTTVVKKTTSAAPIQARAPTVLEPILKEVKAAEIMSPLVLVDQNTNLWWVELAKLLIGLSLVFVVLLVVKIKSFQTVKIVGGHFGDDDT